MLSLHLLGQLAQLAEYSLPTSHDLCSNPTQNIYFLTIEYKIQNKEKTEQFKSFKTTSFDQV